MANTLFEMTLDQQKAWIEKALDQQKAAYDQMIKIWSGLFAIPRIVDAAPKSRSPPRRSTSSTRNTRCT